MRLYLQHCTCTRSGFTRIALKTPKSVPAVPSFTSHVTQFIFQYYVDMDLHEKARHILCTSWSDRWLAMLNGFGVKTLLDKECVMYGVTIKLSTIKPLSVGMGNSAT